MGAVTCAKDIIGLSRELSGLTLQYQEVIQQNRELLQDLQWSAFHDHLTRLGNRNKYIHDSETIFAGEAKIGILNLDINNLKLANDRYGHGCGDRLIRQVGSALKQLEEDGSSYAYRVGRRVPADLQELSPGISGSGSRSNPGNDPGEQPRIRHSSVRDCGWNRPARTRTKLRGP